MVTKTTKSKQTSDGARKKAVRKTTAEKPVAKKKATRTKKSEQTVCEELAVSCCSTLKKAMDKGVYTDWDEIGSGDNCKRWFQIKGLMNGNNIAISVSQEGRKKRYTLSILSIQGTEVECDFDNFIYKHKDHVLSMTFTHSNNTSVKHVVKYGE